MPIFYGFPLIGVFTLESCLKCSQRSSPGSDLRYESWYQKLEFLGLPDGEKCITLWSLVLSKYQREMDGWKQTDKRMDTQPTAKLHS